MGQAEDVTLCEELRPILERELARGNVIKEGPSRGWPKPESVFVALRDDSVPDRGLPEGVERSVNVDPHYDWGEDYFCHWHRHVLVCGAPRRR
ncbi:hypothetical protein [Labrys miyagiensis]|uniref:hypothetical protein n=1 Tax=Labrys miyagiensis TaxID=346912 RepID=UPI0024E1434C|nr:hypothetical protein [Labrys miyagiensis]